MLGIGIAGVRAVVEWCHRFFFSLKRKHMTKEMVSSGDVDVRQHQLNAAGVQDSRGTSY